MRGGFGCSPCCDPCPPCEQECVEPHTGDPFETVYTRFFEGVEAGNPTDGYLTATGDSDTDDPYDGMDGSAPWYQQVSGSFSFGSGVTRHPCSINISFWRNSYALGPATIPPAGSTLTYEKITVTCNSGKIIVGDTILEAGQEYETTLTIPVVSGTGDQSENDPATYFGTVNVRPACREASFSVQARIQWETQKRQHILYGKVRECYDEPGFCDEFCDGDPAPEVIYLTISNYTGPGYDEGTPMDIEGTYVLERVPGACNSFFTPWTSALCFSLVAPLAADVFGVVQVNRYSSSQYGIYLGHFAPVGGFCGGFELFTPETEFEICGSGVIHSGTNGQVRIGTALGSGTVYSNKFDWQIEV